MAKQKLVVVGAKLDMGRDDGQVQDDCEFTIMGLVDSPREKFIKHFSGLDNPIAGPLQYLEESLRTVDPKKVSVVYVKSESHPGYLIHVVPETEPKEKLQRDLLTKYLPNTFIYCGLPRDKIGPLSEKEQEIVERWLSGKN